MKREQIFLTAVLTSFLLSLGGILKAQNGVGINTTTPVSTLDVNGSFGAKVNTITTSTTLDDTYSFIICNNAGLITVTLPLASGSTGRIYTLKKVNTGNVSIARTPPNSIEGSNSPWLIEDNYEVVKVVSDGQNWDIMDQVTPVAKGGSTGGSWTQGGNAVTAVKSLGTTTNYDLPFITNNVERMRINAATGDVGIGTSAFDATYPEQLLVDAGTTTSVNAIAAKGTINSYLQLNIQNKSNGNTASSDLVATANNGSESVNYVDLGINGGGNNSTGAIGGANNAYLYSMANDFSIGNATATRNLTFFTGGTASANERMRIDGNGNVAIGTTTFDGTYPEQLVVDAGTTTSVNAICGKGTINSYLQLNIKNNSNGTAASSDLVATANNGNESSNYVDLGINGGGNTSTGVIGGLNNAYLYSMANDFSIGNATAAKNLLFFTGGTASANERMRIDGNGNVAVGATAFDATYPEQLLVDAGTTTSVNAICGKGTINSYLQLNIQNKSAGTAASSDIVATANNGSESSNYIDMGINGGGNTSTGVIGGLNNTYLYSLANDFSIGNATAAKNLIFFTGGTASANERMRIDGSGNVGIGTTTPTTTLNIRGTYTGYTGGLKLENVTGSSAAYIIPGVGVGATADAASVLYEITGSGFHVFSDHVIPDGNNTWDLGTTANRWRDVWCSRNAFNGSDRRMKKNITPLDYGLNELLKVNTYSYNWIDPKLDDGNRYLGVIAQELREIMPELIRESNEGDKLMSVNYTGLIPVLINAVKQQQQLIEQLTNQNAVLQQQGKDVKNELDNLKTEMKTINEFIKTIAASQAQR